MSRMERSSHQLSKFLLIVLCIICINSVGSSGNELSTLNLTNDVQRNTYSVNSTRQDVGVSREGRLFHKDSRLFGARRRIQFALLPVMFKLGVIVTMLVGLSVMAMKGLTIGVILLFFALGQSLLKYKWHQPQPPVHFHVHPGDHHSSVPVYHHGYHHHGESWDKAADQSEPVEAYENYDPGVHKKISPYKYYGHHHFPYPYHK